MAHPTPTFERERWQSLDGRWRFCVRNGDTLELPDSWEGDIRVPFCLQAPRSGALDSLPAARLKELGLSRPPLAAPLRRGLFLWYRRRLPRLPAEWYGEGTRVILHIGACDSVADVAVNGVWFPQHVGGSTRFSVDITQALRSGSTASGSLHVRCADRLPDDRGLQPCGKQIQKPYPGKGPHLPTLYSNVTGIWQHVWLESVSARAHLERVKVVPVFDESEGPEGQWYLDIHASLPRSCDRGGLRLAATLLASRSPGAEELLSARAALDAAGRRLRLRVPRPARPWSPEAPHLYGLRLELLAGREVIDTVRSYAALRTVRCQGDQVLLNGRPYFLRLVLDQGWYPDGLWTAPSSEAARMDIVRAQRMGFNGARCHQKVFQPAYFSHADALGFLCFAEYPDWPGGQSGRWTMADEECYRSTMEREWSQTVDALHNHPSIVAWGMFNEMGPKNGWKFHHGPGGGFSHWRTPKDRREAQETHENLVVRVAKAIRSHDLQRRPIHDVSGWVHVPQSKPDVWSLHLYSQKPENFQKVLMEPHEKYVHGRRGQPLLVSEYGGVGLDDGGPLSPNRGGAPHGGPVRANGKNPPTFLIGYNGTPGLPENAAVALRRIDELTSSIYEVESLAGFCYTQLYDVEYEKNGLLRYDRRPKRGLPLAALRKIFSGARQQGRWKGVGVRRTLAKRRPLVRAVARRVRTARRGRR